MNRDYGWQHRGVDGASGSGGGNDAEQKQTEKSANERYTHHTERARRNAIPTIHISFYSLAFFPSIQFCGVGAIRLGFTFIFVLISVIFLMVFCTQCCMRVHCTHTSNARTFTFDAEICEVNCPFFCLSMARSLCVYLLLWPKCSSPIILHSR